MNRPIYRWPPTIHRFAVPANLALLVETLGLEVVPACILKSVEKVLTSELAGLLKSELYSAGSKVAGLAKLFADLKITEHLGAADAFCKQHGANQVADLKRVYANDVAGPSHTYAKEMATKLNLPTILADRLVEAIGALPDRE